MAGVINMLLISPVSYNFRANWVSSGNTNIRRSFMAQKADTFTKVAFTGNPQSGKRIARDIEYEQYVALSEEEKADLRNKYDRFYSLIDINELYAKERTEKNLLPLASDQDMENFLNVSEGYNKYKDNQIICVGRSPKWFLNTSIWMKDGIEDYIFSAFSSNWYHRNRNGVGPKLYKDEDKMPTKEQEVAYRNYLKSIDCDPASLVKKAQETGKQIIITDYIHSGCGLTSYLDLMSRFAKDQGCLDEFANSIYLYTIGSEEYFEDLGLDNYFYQPRVLLPELLQPYSAVIEQDYHDLSARTLKSILIDKNTNECRSTYYPPAAWNIYNPNTYKTGQIADEELKKMPRVIDGEVNKFTDAMKDYRNLMNFRILDYLYANDLLKDFHITR